MTAEVLALDPGTVEVRDHIRKQLDEEFLACLTDSIKLIGQQQAGGVFIDPATGKHSLIFGQCRLEACKRAGLPFKATLFPHDLKPEEIQRHQLVENIMRTDLEPLEQANALQRMMVDQGFDSNKELAAFLGIDPSTVGKSLQLLRLPEEKQKRIESGESSHAVLSEHVREQPHRKRLASFLPSAKDKKREIKLGGGIVVTVSARVPINDDFVLRSLKLAVEKFEKKMKAPGASK